MLSNEQENRWKKSIYNSCRITFDKKAQFNFGFWGFSQDVIIFGVANSSPKPLENVNSNFLLLEIVIFYY